MLMFFDKLAVSDARRTTDGYLVANAAISRSGIQEYLGSEVGKPEMHTVRVYRPDEEVFQADSMASAAHKPVTNSHPPMMVTADNWKKYAVGFSGGDVARDGDLLRMPLMLTDRQAIKDWEDGKRELSCGYECILDFTPGRTADGQDYDAVQRKIIINHVAMEDRGRGGPRVRLGDAHPEPELENPMNLKKITFDGLTVEVTDAGAEVIAKLQQQLTDAKTVSTTAQTQVATLTTQLSAKDAEIVTLKQQLEDAKVTPKQMRDAARAFALTIDQAKKLVPTLSITDSMDESAVRKAVVVAKLGDVAKDWTDAQYETSFRTLTAGVKVDDRDPLRSALSDGTVDVGDAATKAADARTKHLDSLRNAYKTPAAA